MLCFQEDELTYNALEEDIAVLNLYFGASTVQGDREINRYVSNFIKYISLRVSKVAADDTGGLHFQPWWVLWTLSWIQHHLIHRDCLLVHHCALSEHFKKIKENSNSHKRSCIEFLFRDKRYDQEISNGRSWEVFW